MNETVRQLIQENNTAALAEMIRIGALSVLPDEDKGGLPRYAALLGRCDVLRLLSERCAGTALDRDATGRDVLHEAARSGDLATVRFAVERLGMDPVRGDINGITALDLAANDTVRTYLEDICGFSLSESYRNPVRRGFSPDPSVVRIGEDYYLINSSFVEFPGLPISHSRDLIHWKTIGHAIEDLETSGLNGMPGGFGYWAPDISYDGSEFWVICTLRRNTAPFRLQMLTHAKRPEGPWSKPVFLDIDGIDPSIFMDDDGRRYIIINRGAQIAELSPEGELLSQPEMLYFGTDRRKSEGPHLIKKDGWYYLFQAEGGTGTNHMETVSRCRTLRGVYEPCPFNPILGRKDVLSPIQRSGHGKPFMTHDGRWYMLYLCGRSIEGKTVLGRETALDPMEWTSDGWPMVNHLKGPSCLQKLPFSSIQNTEITPGIDPMDLMSPRSDPKTFLESIPGGWRLQAGRDLNTLEPVSAVFLRQKESCFTLSAAVDITNLEEGSSAGLASYYDELTWLLAGLRRNESGCTLIITTQVGEEREERILAQLDGFTHTLAICTDCMQREILCDGTAVFALATPFLSDEGAKGPKRFTGTLNGLAAIGNGTAGFTDFIEK